MTPAANPSDVLWENQGYSWTARFKRKLLSAVLTLILIVVAVVCISALYTAQTRYGDSVPSDRLCRDIPSAFLGDYNYGEVGFSRGTDVQDAACGTDRFHFQLSAEHSRANYSTPCTAACVIIDDDTQCNTLACSAPSADHSCMIYKRSDIANCYCKGILLRNIDEHGVIKGVEKTREDFSEVCGRLAELYLIKFGTQAAVSAGTVLLNTVIVTLIRRYEPLHLRTVPTMTRCLPIHAQASAQGRSPPHVHRVRGTGNAQDVLCILVHHGPRVALHRRVGSPRGRGQASQPRRAV